ncbi:hypothetical protein AAY473_029506 [Plecturocebus cupreus]
MRGHSKTDTAIYEERALSRHQICWQVDLELFSLQTNLDQQPVHHRRGEARKCGLLGWQEHEEKRLILTCSRAGKTKTKQNGKLVAGHFQQNTRKDFLAGRGGSWLPSQHFERPRGVDHERAPPSAQELSSPSPPPLPRPPPPPAALAMLITSALHCFSQEAELTRPC